MTEHEWFTERIAAYLAGGLPDEEQLRFEAHRAASADCAKEFESIEQTEKTMTQLFADVAPGMDFESRLLGRLRFREPLRIHPMIRSRRDRGVGGDCAGRIWMGGESADAEGGVEL